MVTVSILTKEIDDTLLTDVPSAVIAKTTTKSFIIVLDRYAEKDLRFSWTATHIGQIEETIGKSAVGEAVEDLAEEASSSDEASLVDSQATSSAEIEE